MSENNTNTATNVATKPANPFITRAEDAKSKLLGAITTQMEQRGLKLDEYSVECAMNAVSTIAEMLYTNGLTWGSPNLDASNYTDIIKKVALLKLNTASSNREVYFQFRNVKVGTEWKKMLEMGIEGDGNDAILRTFGVDVETVLPYWAVRENDLFEYPTYNGIEMTPPKWTPKGKGKVVRVVYPIKLKNGTIDYRIAEREDVVRNLHAHIMNNMMNETFGICADRYKATPEQKIQIEQKKQEIKAKIKNMALDELLDFPEVQKWISPSWSEPHSRESMILRKMRNNAVKKFPKNFGSAYANDTYNELSDETVRTTVAEIRTEANTGEVIDVDFKDVEHTPEPKAIAAEVNNGD